MNSKDHRGHLLLALLLPLLVLTWSCKREFEAPELPYSTLLPTAQIALLGECEAEGVKVPEGVIISGRVSANDLSGNFYRSIVVEDASGAVEVCLAMWELSGLYPVGCEVTIDASGLAVTRTDGVLTLGWEIYAWGDGRVEPISPREEILERVVVSHRGEGELVPTTCALGELTPQMCGRLVRLECLRARDVGEAWAVTEYGTNVDMFFADADGAVVVVRTSRYADFASQRVPEGEVNICGILYSDKVEGEQRYVIKMRDLNDVERW